MTEIATEKGVVVVTGSSGHIGSMLVRHLGEHYTVVGMDRPGAPEPPAPAHDIRMDLTDDESVAASLGKVRDRFGRRIASVVHLAAFASFEKEHDPRFEKINVEGTERLLRHLHEFEVEQFLYSSTMLVHAPTLPGKPIDASARKEPAWGYPESKLAAEKIISKQHDEIPYVILRMAGVYNDEGGLPALAQQIARINERQLKARVFPGDSSHGQAAVHLDDLLDVVGRAIERRRDIPRESVFMVGEPDVPSYAQLQEEIGRLIHGEPWDVQEIPKAVAKSGAWLQEAALPEDKEPFIKHWMIDIADAHYELDISATRRELGWEPQHRLMDTLPKIIDALKKDPRGWYEMHQLDYPGDEEEPKRREQKATQGKPEQRRGSDVQGRPGSGPGSHR